MFFIVIRQSGLTSEEKHSQEHDGIEISVSVALAIYRTRLCCSETKHSNRGKVRNGYTCGHKKRHTPKPSEPL